MLALCFAVQFVHADVFVDLAGYKYGAGVNLAEQAFQEVLKAKPEQKPEIEQKLIAVISNKEATQDGKAWACRCLQIIGTEASVPALGTLLGDEILSDYARIVLERMTGSKAANEALRNSLDKAPAKAQVGILASLGEMKDASAVKQASALAKSSDTAVAIAAVTALGKIGDSKSADALLKLQPAEAIKQAYLDGVIECAGNVGGKSAVSLCEKALASDSIQHRVAGMLGMLTSGSDKGIEVLVSALGGDNQDMRNGALTAVATVQGEKITSACVKALGELEGAPKAALINVVGERGDRAALTAIIACIGSEDKAVHAAALKAIGEMGGSSAAKKLMSIAVDSANREEIMKTISRMPGREIDEVVIAALTDSKLRVIALAMVSERGVADAQPQLLKCAKDADPAVQEAAWKALGASGGVENIAPMMTALVEVEDENMQGKALDAVGRLLGGEQNKGEAFKAIVPYYKKVSVNSRKRIISFAASAGTDEAFNCVKSALDSGDESLYDSALRSLAAWPNDKAADTLLVLAKDAPSEAQRIIALRGVIALTNHRHVKLNDDQRVALLKKAVGLAKRTDEKRQIISSLQNRGTAESLEVLTGLLSDEAVAKDACHGLVTAADRARRHHKEASIKALNAVAKKLEAPEADQKLKKRVMDLLKSLQPEK